MIKIASMLAILWLLLFSLRIIQIGGIDPTYRQEGSHILEPLQTYLDHKIDAILPYPQSGLLSGIILGINKNLPFTLRNQLKTTSTIHIVVVSGQNLTILAGFVMSLAPFLGRKKTSVLTIGVVLLYCVLTGLGIPAIRAASMVLLTYLAKIIGKDSTGLWVLLLTAATMLLFQPNWLLNISFQLSFLATLGVVAVGPVFISSLSGWPKFIREDLAITLAAQLLVTPVIAYNFNQLSLVGLFANVFVLWSIPLVMVSGLLSLAISLVSITLGQVMGLVPGVLLTYFMQVVGIFAKLPGASLKVGETGIILWVGYYLMIIAGVWALKVKIIDENFKIQKSKF